MAHQMYFEKKPRGTILTIFPSNREQGHFSGWMLQ